MTDEDKTEQFGNVSPLTKEIALTAEHTQRQERARKARGGKLNTAKRRARVLELRAAGLTEEQIGEEIGLKQARVSKIITRALQDLADRSAENADLIRAQKLFELDQLKRAIWANALRGDLKAVNTAIKIIQVQSRISGAEAPVKIERHTTVDIEIDQGEVKRMEEAWLHSGGDVIEGTLREELD